MTVTRNAFHLIETRAASEIEPLSAVFLTDSVVELNEGAGFLDRLDMDEIGFLRGRGTTLSVSKGETAFLQGDEHDGIFLIETGRIRSPSNTPPSLRPRNPRGPTG